MSKNQKKGDQILLPYVKPIITITYICLENCLANGSARVISPNEEGYIMEEWDVEQNRNENFDW